MVATVRDLTLPRPEWRKIANDVRSRALVWAKRFKLGLGRQKKNLLTLNGFVFGSAAAFTIGVTLGLCAVAVSSFILSVIGED